MLGVLKRTISMNQALQDLNLTNMYTVPRVEGIYLYFIESCSKSAGWVLHFYQSIF